MFSQVLYLRVQINLSEGAVGNQIFLRLIPTILKYTECVGKKSHASKITLESKRLSAE